VTFLEGRPIPVDTVPAVPALYRSLAVGDYLLGRTDLGTAARLAEMTTTELTSLVSTAAAGSVGQPMLSVVVPVFNNETTLVELHRRVREVAAPLGTFELILVDDGSADDSAEVARAICDGDPAVRFIRLSRNFGQQAALSAGLDAARGSAVVMMDADLQDPPELIAELVRRWRDGNDVVCALRRNRKESLGKRAAYALYYRALHYLAEIDITLDSGEFSLLDRKVVEIIRAMPERGRLLRGMRSWSGFRQSAVAYDRPARESGRSQYTLRRLVRLAIDGLVGFSSVPLQLVSALGMITALLGLVLFAVIVGIRLTSPDLPIGWTSTLGGILLVGGVQLITIGMVGAYVSRIYTEVRNRPLYVVMERVG
jgi:dolichol-phosphate mannosyltransferase